MNIMKNMENKILCLLVIICFMLCSCNSDLNSHPNNKITIGSKWTFIKIAEDKKITYYEIEFVDRNTINILSEEDGFLGGGVYEFTSEGIRLNSIDFQIEMKEYDSYIVYNLTEKYLLYRIPFDDVILDTNQVDPFLIRNYYYKVNLNKISTDSAIYQMYNTLQNSKELMQSIQEFEIH